MMHGVYTALVTPFTKTGQLDEKALIRLIDHQIKGGIDGILVLGTTGESPTIEHDEKRTIITTAREKTKGKTQLLVGCGTNNTKTTIKNVIEATNLGADCLLIVSPYYNKPSQNGLYEHFKTVAQETHLPICIYNIAGRTGVNIETATLEKLAQIPNIIAVKDSSGNILQMNDVADAICEKKKDFALLSGDDPLTLPLIAFGGHGVISVISNLVPSMTKRFVSAALKGDFAEARNINRLLKPLVKAAFIEVNPVPIKYMLSLYGLCNETVRLPLVELIENNKHKVKEVCAAAQFIRDEITQ